MNEMMRFRSRSLVRVVRAASGVAGALVLSAPAFATTTIEHADVTASTISSVNATLPVGGHAILDGNRGDLIIDRAVVK